jgi:hypothetical protein
LKPAVSTANEVSPAKLPAAGKIPKAPLYVPLKTFKEVTLKDNSVNPLLTAKLG